MGDLPWESRFLSQIEGIATFCQGHPLHAACYDTSHLRKSQEEVIADIESYARIIKCFHLSNRSQLQQHLPLRHPEGELSFPEILKAILESGFSGPIVLEYLKEHHRHLVEDALWVKRQLYKGGNE